MEKKLKRNIFIGAAWPYANASLHLGHIAALMPADIIARYYRQKGDDVLFVSGSDCHGTPIILAAEAEKTTPEKVSKKYHQEFIETLIDGLQFSYDNYTTTLTQNHTRVVQEFFTKLNNNGDISIKEQKLPYCPKCEKFLPDRYMEGTCPKCNFKDARGDQCDSCGQMLDPEDLIEPRCKTCSTKPEFKDTKHFFLNLSKKEGVVKELLKNSTGWRKNAVGFTNKYLNEGLKDRAITRDISWGVDIPLDGYDDKKIYVWFDAVCGYLSASKEICDENEKWKKFWENKDAIHYYVHGKDNIPFHTIIWPIMLDGFGGLKQPDYIISSEYLTLEKKQFSKSRKWAIWAKDILGVFEADLVRFYLTINSPETSDSDFSWHDFQNRINSELIGNFGNFVNRTASLIANNYSNGIAIKSESGYLQSVKKLFRKVGEQIECGDLREALKTIIKISGDGNKYLAENEPWKLLKSDRDKSENVLANCACSIACIQTLINPFLPTTAENISKIFDFKESGWEPNTDTTFSVREPKILFEKIEDSTIEEQIKMLNSGESSK